ncbi:hypothetical protein [Mycolicibacterium iranicum]|uniref:Uncharacterized protein n=1 Tax=Mycolicibacterium iranicum TaxID=912594 RepID=A0A178M1X8_MYCIR|nr:hypothetical protein [Mycolicibacterium iranicum]OAN41143.1 hypothetical protein A4X20_30570 [Mycolicibacterium iranicum]
MTNQIFDDRAAAYVGARERLKAAESLKVTERGELKCGLADPLPPLYWGLLAEAQILAELASADSSVGLIAGNYLLDQEERIERNRGRERARRLVETLERPAATADAPADSETPAGR